MADVHDKATRSKNMRAIATRDTAIEKRLASLLTGQGLAFRVQDASLPGSTGGREPNSVLGSMVS